MHRVRIYANDPTIHLDFAKSPFRIYFYMIHKMFTREFIFKLNNLSFYYANEFQF